MSNRDEHGEELLNKYPLTEHLAFLTSNHLTSLDHQLHTQTIVNILVQAAKIAKAAGYDPDALEPFDEADPELLFAETERMLSNLMLLVRHAQLLAGQQAETPRRKVRID